VTMLTVTINRRGYGPRDVRDELTMNKAAMDTSERVDIGGARAGRPSISPPAYFRIVARCVVHISAVEKAGLPGLNEGRVVEYEEVSNRGKTSAENLKVQR
jgi:hypothetical protein